MADVAGANRELTPEEQARVDKAMAEIEEIWSDKNRGSYKITDDEAWKRMPLFMERVTEDDVLNNPDCAALSDIIYKELPPTETAENMKEQGNKALQLALNPDKLKAMLQEKHDLKQYNIENILRNAVHCYTEGIKAQSDNRKLNSQLYSNRSMAHFLLQNYGHGLQDAQRAIILDPDYTKAYYRGAKCAEKIRKYEISRSLIEKGLRTNPTELAEGEFSQLLSLIQLGEKAAAEKLKKEKMKARVDAADSNALVRTLQSRGVRISNFHEVSSEQWAQVGQKKPFFDETDVLHVPILFMYDEYNTTDFLQAVPCDASLAEILTEEGLMPFPWDDKGRYKRFEDMAAVFKIDDHVAMPLYYVADWHWTLFEVLRRKEYQMPGLIVCFHIVPKESDLMRQWGLTV